jgi:GNAT superfamily N-acetyltransferase
VSESFDILYDPAESARVSRFVVSRFFTPRELPQAVGRALFTRDFLLCAGLPLGVIGGAYAAPEGPLRQALLWIALGWLAVAAGILLTLGKSRAIGCRTSDGALAGGLRLKVSKRRVCLAGVVVEPAWRGKGVFTALLLGAFRLAAQVPGPRALTVFGPAHPASKHVVGKYFGGALSIPVGGEVFARSLAALEAELAALEAKGIRYRFSLSAMQ